MYDTDVLLVGAGPTGLTLAIDLQRRGLSCRLIEASPAPFAGSRGKGLQPRTLEVFDDLGVIREILAAGAPYPKFRTHVGPLSIRAGSLGSGKPPTEGVPYPGLWMVPQFRTEEILRERLRQLGGTVEFGKPLAAFTQHAHAVEARLATGENVRAGFLVGCDGGHSTVRKQLGVRFEGESLEGKRMLVADVEVEGLDRRDWHIWPLAKGGPLGLCPLPHTSLFQLTAGAQIEDLDGAVRRATGYNVRRIAWRSLYQASVRMVDRYRAGRVFLAGDAAHVHPPSGGQGLNTGVQDAYNLGWKLGHVLRGGPDALLDTYEAERLPVAAAVLGLSRKLLETRSMKRGDATNQLRLNYRTSPLSSGVPFGDLHPGDRMPNLRLSGGEMLFDRLRGPHATELVVAGGIRILIRPDGYIGRIGAGVVGEGVGSDTHEVDVCAMYPVSPWRSEKS